jgi:hypothetical protein
MLHLDALRFGRWLHFLSP